MPMPPISNYWRDRIWSIRAEQPGRSAQKILDELVDEKRGEVPSLSTVGRVAKKFDDLEERQKLPYQSLSWPASFESGALPWEASGALLDFLGYVRPFAGLARPTVELGLAFWHATLSAPGADIETQIEITARLILGKTDELETYLMRRGYALKDGKPREVLPPLDVDLLEGRTATVLHGLPLLISYEDAARMLDVESLDPVVYSGYLMPFQKNHKPGVFLGAVLELADNLASGRFKELFIDPSYWQLAEQKKGGKQDG